MQLEEKKKYRVTHPSGMFMEFIPMTIDRDKDELYIKITAPFSSHQGVVLSSMENNPMQPELVIEL